MFFRGHARHRSGEHKNIKMYSVEEEVRNDYLLL
eukprot:SAG11_NODE_19026_length_475_cov_3.917553_1_plen_33_part_10